MRFWPSPCSEFPNDNPELHEGSVWLCSTNRARPKAVVRARHVAAAGQAAAPPAMPTEVEAPSRPELLPPSMGEAPITLAELVSPLDEPASAPALDAAVADITEPHAAEPHATAPSDELDRSDTLIEALGDDPFVAELYSLVAPLRTERAPSFESTEIDWTAPSTLAMVELCDAETPEAQVLDSETWPSQWSLDELRETHEREEREIAALEHEVAELREQAASPEISDPALTIPSPPPEEPSAVLEPLTLEDFLSGGSLQLPESAVSQVVPRGLQPIELDLDPVSSEVRAWHAIVSAVSHDLLQRNAVRAAALLPRIVEGQPMSLERLPSTQKECLLLEGIAESRGTQLVLTTEFMRRSRRMRRAFIGGRLDAPTLTSWLATIVRALLATPHDQETILAEWREAGVIDTIERAA